MSIEMIKQYKAIFGVSPSLLFITLPLLITMCVYYIIVGLIGFILHAKNDHIVKVFLINRYSVFKNMFIILHNLDPELHKFQTPCELPQDYYYFICNFSTKIIFFKIFCIVVDRNFILQFSFKISP